MEELIGNLTHKAAETKTPILIFVKDGTDIMCHTVGPVEELMTMMTSSFLQSINTKNRTPIQKIMFCVAMDLLFNIDQVVTPTVKTSH